MTEIHKQKCAICGYIIRDNNYYNEDWNKDVCYYCNMFYRNVFIILQSSAIFLHEKAKNRIPSHVEITRILDNANKYFKLTRKAGLSVCPDIAYGNDKELR